MVYEYEGEILMAGSGKLGMELATAFEMPHATVTTVIKALRADKIIRVSGRGSSAAQMTPDDAIALIVGIASAAVTAEVAMITKRLIEMPLRHSVKKGWSDIAVLLAPHVLVLPEAHQFKAGFRALFDEAWKERPLGYEFDDMGGIRKFDPMDDIDALRVSIGVNALRTEGFAVIEARVTEEKKLKNFYSTQLLRPDIEKNEDPGGLGLSLYQSAPPFVFSAVLDGRAVVSLAQVLAAPISEESRKRGHRRPPGNKSKSFRRRGAAKRDS
jgi:hypothetical protein